MSFRQTLARPITASEAITAGQVVRITTGQFDPLDGPTDQAATAAVKPAGVALTSAAVGAECTVCFDGPCDALIGATAENGDELVAEYQTGRLIPYDAAAYAEGAEIWIAARLLEDAVDGQNARINVNIYLKTVPTAPA